MPGNVREADVLTQYAVQSRYPGFSEEITGEEYRDVLALSARVVFWVKTLLGA
ncbi:MAG: HEPN domain-containing protein [Chloroflexota bacterium]